MGILGITEVPTLGFPLASRSRHSKIDRIKVFAEKTIRGNIIRKIFDHFLPIIYEYIINFAVLTEEQSHKISMNLARSMVYMRIEPVSFPNNLDENDVSSARDIVC